MTKKKAVAASAACFVVLAAGDICCHAFANCRGKKITPSTLYSVPYLPNIEEEGDDGSFFLAASQQAAKDRFELLKKGIDPLAISLSSVPIAEEQETAEKEVDEAPTVNELSDNKGQTGAEKMKVSSPTVTVENDDYDGMLSSLSESPLAQSLEEKKKIEADIEPSTTLDEITRVESETAAIKSEIKDKIQCRKDDANSTYDANQPVVGEGSTAEEMETARYTRLAAADEIAKKLNSGEDFGAAPLPPVLEGAGATSEEVQERTAEESEAIREARLTAADEIAKSFRKSVDDSTISSTTKSLTLSGDDNEEDEAKEAEAEPVAAAATKAENNEEPSNADQPQLSSDGKLIYEPSHSAMNMNQENVENGLLLLTRSFLMLNSIVQRHLDEEEDNE